MHRPRSLAEGAHEADLETVGDGVEVLEFLLNLVLKIWGGESSPSSQTTYLGGDIVVQLLGDGGVGLGVDLGGFELLWHSEGR